MRLASDAKAGFYPIDPLVIQQIATHLTAPHGGRVCDPCAGEAAALLTLADRLRLSPFGNELNQARASHAAQAVTTWLEQQHAHSLPHNDKRPTRIFQTDIRRLRTSDAAFNLLYLNPPYADDATDRRLELTFLRQSRRWLQPHGILVYVVPQHILRLKETASYLASYFDEIKVRRHPAEQRHFGEITLFARYRPRTVTPAADTVAWLQAIGRQDPSTPLPALGDDPFNY
ncbi:MAG TPA: class I SAM-dependent methyltransferase, partial [Anaerolineae bacterium]|nr:class I SAM-dependent methyltransferase [Anaerolineae bacterium]